MVDRKQLFVLGGLPAAGAAAYPSSQVVTQVSEQKIRWLLQV